MESQSDYSQHDPEVCLPPQKIRKKLGDCSAEEEAFKAEAIIVIT